ncbi:MAG: NTP transferase domain-containing protein, partial [Litorivicinus sp.]
MLDVVILAAGQGSRMKSDLPKVLHQVGGIPMIQHVINAVTDMADQIVVVVGHGQAEVRAALAGQTITFVEQTEQLGTGHALAQALPVLNPASTCLMLYGDGPLILRSDIDALVAAAAAGQYALLTANLPNPTGYGRILRDGGQPVAIVEEKDASVAQRAVTEVNTGLLCAPTASFADYLPKLSSSNAQGEYYVTDCLAMAVT